MTGIFYIFSFIFGTVFGSFLSVVIERLPKEQSIVAGRSHCPHCKHVLGPLELIPLVSYFVQKGKCKNCGAKIGVLYPLLEVTTGLLFVLALWLALAAGQSSLSYIIVTYGYYCALFVLLFALFFIDLFEQLLLDVLVFPALGLTFVYHLFLYWTFFVNQHGLLPRVDLRFSQFPSSPLVVTVHYLTLITPIAYGYLFGFGVALFFLLLLLVTRGKGMGGGDVKYALVLGAVAGWPEGIVALFSAFVTGAIVSLILLLFGRKQLHQVIPFGPFLIFGTVFGLLFGRSVVDIYLSGILG